MVIRDFKKIRGYVGKYLRNYRAFSSLKNHKSRLSIGLAGRYTDYWKKSQDDLAYHYFVSEPWQKKVNEFECKGYTTISNSNSYDYAQSILKKLLIQQSKESIWDESGSYKYEIYNTFPEIEKLFKNILKPFLQGVYKTYFKIYYGVLYKSERTADEASGSQLWHADSGPGTCINVMFYLSDATLDNGALECLPWDQSKKIYKRELFLNLRELNQSLGSSKLESRQRLCEFYANEIQRNNFQDYIVQPLGQSGLIVPFMNNTLHRGGFPEQGNIRYSCVFHCYPSHEPTPYKAYQRYGISKQGSYPKDPVTLI